MKIFTKSIFENNKSHLDFVPMCPRTAPHFSESALLSLLLVSRVIFAVRRLYGGQADGYCREFCSKKSWWLRLRAASVATTVLSPSPRVFAILEFSPMDGRTDGRADQRKDGRTEGHNLSSSYFAQLKRCHLVDLRRHCIDLLA